MHYVFWEEGAKAVRALPDDNDVETRIFCHFEHFRISTGLLFMQNRSLFAMCHYQLCKHSNMIRNITGSVHVSVTYSLLIFFLLA